VVHQLNRQTLGLRLLPQTVVKNLEYVFKKVGVYLIHFLIAVKDFSHKTEKVPIIFRLRYYAEDSDYKL
jgi:surface polysaccharide O-acyltransferase-like enzyme